jgi:hypothetical protein
MQVADSWEGLGLQRKYLDRWSIRSDFLMTSQSVQLPLLEEPIRSKYLMTSQYNSPGQIFQTEPPSSWQLSHFNFPGTLESLRGSCLAGGHGRRDSNSVASWRNLALFCGEGMSYCSVSSKHERWIQGQVPTFRNTAAAFLFSTLPFSCGEAWGSRVAVDPCSRFLTESAASRYWRCTVSTLFSKNLGHLPA